MQSTIHLNCTVYIVPFFNVVIHLPLCCSTVSVTLILTCLSFIEYCFYKFYANILWWPLCFPAKQNFIVVASCIVDLSTRNFIRGILTFICSKCFFINGDNCSNILSSLLMKTVVLFHKLVVSISMCNSHNIHSMARFFEPFCHGFPILLRKKFHNKVIDYESSFVIKFFDYFSFLFFLMHHFRNVSHQPILYFFLTHWNHKDNLIFFYSVLQFE